MKKLNSLFYILFAFALCYIGYEIISNKVIYGSRGAPNLYLGNYSYLVGGLFIIYGIYIVYFVVKDIFKAK